MSDHSQENRRKLGAVLLKLRNRECDYTEEELQLARVLEGRGLARFVGPDQSPKFLGIEETYQHMQLAALAHYVLTGMGEDFVLRHPEAELRGGRFILPGETPWYDRWPWKLVWPALVSIVTTLFVQAIRGF
jgi:hypothetical protein